MTSFDLQPGDIVVSHYSDGNVWLVIEKNPTWVGFWVCLTVGFDVEEGTCWFDLDRVAKFSSYDLEKYFILRGGQEVVA